MPKFSQENRKLGKTPIDEDWKNYNELSSLIHTRITNKRISIKLKLNTWIKTLEFISILHKDALTEVFGPIKVNLEFSFSFLGFSFSGLNTNIYSGFKPEIQFILEFLF